MGLFEPVVAKQERYPLERLLPLPGLKIELEPVLLVEIEWVSPP